MYLLLESIFVGIYVVILYKCIGSHYFLLGFLKHYLAYWMGLQKYFCNQRNYKKWKRKNNIITQSILEGIFFFISCQLLTYFFQPTITVFFVGVFFHLIAEYMGLHRFFCKSF